MGRLLYAAVTLSLLVGCEKQGSLAGELFSAYKRHVNSINNGIIQMDGYDVYTVYRFIDRTTLERSERQNSPTGKIIGEIDKGNYAYEYPSVQITYYDSSLNRYITETGEFLDKDTFRIGKLEYTKQ